MSLLDVIFGKRERCQAPNPLASLRAVSPIEPLPMEYQGANPALTQSATVGTSSMRILDRNPMRKGLVITNLSANTVSLSFGAPAGLNAGITLTPLAQPDSSITMADDSGAFSIDSVWAIASAAGSNISFREF